MPMSAQMKEVHKHMERIDDFVRHNGLGVIPANPKGLSRFNFCVSVRHEDGSTMFFENAYAVMYDKYLLVFTEHNGDHIFHQDDLSDTMGWGMYQKSSIPTLKGRTWEEFTQPKNSPFDLRDKVRTKIDPDQVSDDWDDPGTRRHDALGTVVKTSDAHGLCYKVKYEDGETGWFDPWELKLVEKA